MITVNKLRVISGVNLEYVILLFILLCIFEIPESEGKELHIDMLGLQEGEEQFEQEVAELRLRDYALLKNESLARSQDKTALQAEATSKGLTPIDVYKIEVSTIRNGINPDYIVGAREVAEYLNEMPFDELLELKVINRLGLMVDVWLEEKSEKVAINRLVEKHKNHVNQSTATNEEKKLSPIIGSAHILLGNKNADITIVAVTDFYCQYCNMALRNLFDMSNDTQMSIKIEFLHNSYDGTSEELSKAAVCAANYFNDDKLYELYSAFFRGVRSENVEEYLWQEIEIIVGKESASKIMSCRNLRYIEKQINFEKNIIDMLNVRVAPQYYIHKDDEIYSVTGYKTRKEWSEILRE